MACKDDLLAFQISHFGDDTKPDTWFVDAETALNFDPALNDDGLGYYEDGVKRTLTDEQIEMFRHTEMELLLREEQLRKEQDDGQIERIEPRAFGQPTRERSVSTSSNVSSVEGDLLGLAQAELRAPQLPDIERKLSRGDRSEASSCAASGQKGRSEDIPYDQRHKRKWEGYIEDNDPVEGSLTHRRIVREMDEQHEASIDLDY